MSSKKSKKTDLEHDKFDARSQLSAWLDDALEELRSLIVDWEGLITPELIDHPDIKVRTAYKCAGWCIVAREALDENDVDNLTKYVIYATEANEDRKMVKWFATWLSPDLVNGWRDWASKGLDGEGLADIESSDLFEHTKPIVREAARLKHNSERAVAAMRDKRPRRALWHILNAEASKGRCNFFVGKLNLEDIKDQVARQQRGFTKYNERSKQQSRILADRASELREQDWTIAAIALELHRSEKQVGRYLKNNK